MKMQKTWRPRIKEGQVSIRRDGNFFVIVCRNRPEADAMEKAVIRSLSKSRKNKYVDYGKTLIAAV